jgi:hypothetical protein
MFGDNPDFYPTPRHVARKMLAKITTADAKYYLDPSAGKGDIADVIMNPTTYEEFCTDNPEYEERRRSERGWGAFHNAGRNSRVKIDVIESYPALVQ